MKISDFKKMLKPYIKECIKEVLMKDGFISSIIKESVAGAVQGILLESNEMPARTKKEKPSQEQFQQQVIQEESKKRQNLSEQKKMLLNAIGKNAYGDIDLFEGTTPLTNQRSPIPTEKGDYNGPLGNLDPNDSGVPIDFLFKGKK